MSSGWGIAQDEWEWALQGEIDRYKQKAEYFRWHKYPDEKPKPMSLVCLCSKDKQLALAVYTEEETFCVQDKREITPAFWHPMKWPTDKALGKKRKGDKQ